MARQAPKNTTGKGYFTVQGSEPLSKRTLHVRVPESLEAQARELAGNDLSGWLRRAIAAQVERDREQKAKHSKLP